MSEAASLAEYGSDDAGLAHRWCDEIVIALKAREAWLQQAKKVLRRYKDERSATNDDRRLNILWSNVQTLGPAIYAQVPKCIVQRRFQDPDPIARSAITVLQRATQASLDENDFDQVMRQCRDDYLLVGRGTTWQRYEPTFAAAEGDAADNGDPPPPRLVWESAPTDYVHWQDFLHPPARTWSEVPWVARRAFMKRDAGRARFGAIFAEVPLDNRKEDAPEDAPKELFQRAVVWEIWDKETRKVVWIAPSFKDRPLDVRDDMLELDGFFPCPKPLLATTTNDSIIPVPDFVLYQDQAHELDEMTARISKLARAIRVRGAYDKANGELERILSEGTDQDMFPVENWVELTQKGGIAKAVDFLPIDMMAKTLTELVANRAAAKQDLYEITGISDIIRGATQASETATAQNIKSKFATLRLSDRQAEMARFARDAIRLKAEVICRHFSDRTLLAISDYDQTIEAAIQGAPTGAGPVADTHAGIQAATPVAQHAKKALALLRDTASRHFRIDIESDSTIAADEQQDRDDAVQFLQALGGFIQQASTIVQEQPAMQPLLGQLLMFGVRRFRVGRDLEASLEETLQAIPPPQPKPPEGSSGPAPEEVAANVQQIQAKTQAATQESAAKVQQTQAATQGAAQLAALQAANLQSQIQDRQARLQMDAEGHAIAQAQAARKMAQEEERHRQEMDLRQVEATRKAGEAASK